MKVIRHIEVSAHNALEENSLWRMVILELLRDILRQGFTDECFSEPDFYHHLDWMCEQAQVESDTIYSFMLEAAYYPSDALRAFLR